MNGSFEHDSTVRGSQEFPADTVGIPPKIGPYAVRRRIASGGMGTVYEAFQEAPRRAVAVKVMRASMISAESLRRFQFEAQILARMQHPGIAQVYEIGTWTSEGSEVPFIAMEYVAGAKPITEYVRENRLSLRDRLRLFLQVCDAVHHGHQKGIVHRDLKPGNVLCDGSGRVRVIDFGVAHATDSDLVQPALQTMAGQIVGSLPYMSPEQFEADPHNIDTRSDVYSLGVILYEVLSGRHPHELASSDFRELAERVRGTEPRRIGDIDPVLKGEVEAVVHKALSREKELRYQSAFGLGEDIRRYLSGEAISARPQTLRYQFEIFARRNRKLIGTSAALVFLLAAGAVTSTALYIRGHRAQITAQQEAARASALTFFLEEMLTSAAPHDYGKEPTVHDLLDLASQRAGETLRDFPEAEARLRNTISKAYFTLAEAPRAAEEVLTAYRLATDRLGPGHSVTRELGEEAQWLCSATGMHEAALDLALEIETRERELHGPHHPSTIAARYGVAQALEASNRLSEADQILTELIADIGAIYPSDSPEVLDIQGSRAQLLLKMRRDARSLELSRSTYETALQSLPENDAIIAWTRSVYGAALIVAGEFDAAESLYGRRLPDESGHDIVFQGAPAISESGLQLIVFWETWCPFSRRAVPALEPLFRDFRSSGLRVTGLTRMTRNSTSDKVEQFIRENDISFAVAKDDGRSWTWFDARGTPWLVIIRDGRVIWEHSVNSPEQIPSRMIASLVRSD